MSAIGNYLKKLAFALRNGLSTSSKKQSTSPRSSVDEIIADITSQQDNLQASSQKKKRSQRAHLSDFTIF